jgi:hypothetical protein
MCIVSRLPTNGCRNERPILISFFFIDGCLWLTFFPYRLPTNGCRNDRWRHTFSKVLYYCVSVCVCLHIYICTFVSTETPVGGKHSQKYSLTLYLSIYLPTFLSYIVHAHGADWWVWFVEWLAHKCVPNPCVPNVYLWCWQEGASSTPKRKAPELGGGDQVLEVLYISNVYLTCWQCVPKVYLEFGA